MLVYPTAGKSLSWIARTCTSKIATTKEGTATPSVARTVTIRSIHELGRVRGYGRSGASPWRRCTVIAAGAPSRNTPMVMPAPMRASPQSKPLDDDGTVTRDAAG